MPTRSFGERRSTETSLRHIDRRMSHLVTLYETTLSKVHPTSPNAHAPPARDSIPPAASWLLGQRGADWAAPEAVGVKRRAACIDGVSAASGVCGRGGTRT